VERFHETNRLGWIPEYAADVVAEAMFNVTLAWDMAARRQIIEIAITDDEAAELEAVSHSRTQPACRIERARIMLAYRADPSTYAVGEALRITHQTVQRCLTRAVRLGVMAALDDSPRPGKAPEITLDARAWLGLLACQKAKDLG
jgi:hypothetical protein